MLRIDENIVVPNHLITAFSFVMSVRNVIEVPATKFKTSIDLFWVHSVAQKLIQHNPTNATCGEIVVVSLH